MNLAPLSQYPSPDYPTEEALQSEPSLLRAVPRRWKGQRAVLTALAAALALTQGCTPKPSARLAGTPAAPDLQTAKEARTPRPVGPKATATPTPAPRLVPPPTVSFHTLGDPAPPNFKTEADVPPQPSPTPGLSGVERALIRGAIAVPRVSTEEEAKAKPDPSAPPRPSASPSPKL